MATNGHNGNGKAKNLVVIQLSGGQRLPEYGRALRGRALLRLSPDDGLERRERDTGG